MTFVLSPILFHIDHTVGKKFTWLENSSIWQILNVLGRIARYKWPLCYDTFLWPSTANIYIVFQPCKFFSHRVVYLEPESTLKQGHRKVCFLWRIGPITLSRTTDACIANLDCGVC